MLVTLAKLQLCNSIAFLVKTRSDIHRVLHQGLHSRCSFVPCNILSPIAFHSLILPFFCKAGMIQERHLRVMQPLPGNYSLCWVGRGSGFGCWPGNGEEVPFSCLLELWLLPNVQGGGVTRGLKMCMAQLGWCAGFTPQALTWL